MQLQLKLTVLHCRGQAKSVVKVRLFHVRKNFNVLLSMQKSFISAALTPFQVKLVICFSRFHALFRPKFMQLSYGLPGFSLTNSLMKSLDFTVNRVFMKLFTTSSLNFVNDSQIFSFSSYRVLHWQDKSKYFVKRKSVLIRLV